MNKPINLDEWTPLKVKGVETHEVLTEVTFKAGHNVSGELRDLIFISGPGKTFLLFYADGEPKPEHSKKFQMFYDFNVLESDVTAYKDGRVAEDKDKD